MHDFYFFHYEDQFYPIVIHSGIEKRMALKGTHEKFYAWERLSSRETVSRSNAVRGWKAAPTTYRTTVTTIFLTKY